MIAITSHAAAPRAAGTNAPQPTADASSAAATRASHEGDISNTPPHNRSEECGAESDGDLALQSLRAPAVVAAAAGDRRGRGRGGAAVDACVPPVAERRQRRTLVPRALPPAAAAAVGTQCERCAPRPAPARRRRRAVAPWRRARGGPVGAAAAVPAAAGVRNGACVPTHARGVGACTARFWRHARRRRRARCAPATLFVGCVLRARGDKMGSVVRAVGGGGGGLAV